MSEMNPARFERIRELFLALRDLPSHDERALVLGQSCGDDAGLRTEVEALIAAHDEDHRSDHVIDQSPIGISIARMVSDTFDSGGSEEHPATIGAYAIVKLIGEGGMGRVYEARQSKPDRSVAVKVMKSLLPSKDALRRFEREAEMLAKLQHPGIAQVYEFGSFSPNSDSRRQLQFFAMEFVKGDNLSRYVREHNLDTEARLQLMAAICDAVEHAHLRGIIHRDLKPGNILVEETSPPRPKILDFGVARSLEHNEVMRSMQTEVGQIVGTLAYMSPEQVAGDLTRINARTDVYSLGVILYELLTGRLPHNISVTSIAEAARAIQHDDPARPGTINSTLRGDLETIVLKAIERDPGRRYQSAAALAQDIRNFAANRPIDARPPTKAYLFERFARRNKGLVAGASAAIIALVAGLSISLVLYAQAEHARKLAHDGLAATKRAQARAEGINTFVLTDLIEAAQETDDARNIKLVDALSAASDQIPKRFKDAPETRSALQVRVGDMLDRFGEYERSLSMLKEASAELESRLGPDDLETIDARYRLAKVMVDLARHAEAETLFRALADRCMKKSGPDDINTLRCQVMIGCALQGQGKHEEAQTLFKATLPPLRAKVADDIAKALPSLAASTEIFVSALELLAASLVAEKKLQEAEPILLEAIQVVKAQNRPLSAGMLISSYMLANVYMSSEREEAGGKLLDDVIPGVERAFGPESLQMGHFCLLRGKCYADLGNSEAAERMFIKGYEIIEKRLGRSRYETEKANGLLRSFYSREGNTLKLEVTLVRAIELRENVEKNLEHDSVLGVKEEYAAFLLERGRKDEAYKIMEKILPVALRALPQESHIRARVISTAANCGLEIK